MSTIRTPRPRPSQLELLTWMETRDEIARGTPFIFPIGSLEQHGPHLPLGTDGVIPYELAKRLSKRRHFVIAPPLYYAAYSRPRSGGGRSFPGSIGARGPTLTAFLEDLCSDMLRQGVRHLILINGHMENATHAYDALESAVGQVNPSSKALLINWWELITADDRKRFFPEDFPDWGGDHASFVETALLEEMRPDLVKSELKVRGGARRKPNYDIFPVPSDVVPSTGVLWDARTATRSSGRAIVRFLIPRMLSIINEEFPEGAPTRETPGIRTARRRTS